MYIINGKNETFDIEKIKDTLLNWGVQKEEIKIDKNFKYDENIFFIYIDEKFFKNA